MSDAKKCDRCGRFYDPYKAKYVLITNNFNNIKDLCPVCNKALESWLTLKPKEAEDGPKEEQPSRDDNI